MPPFLCFPAPAWLCQVCGSPVCAPEYFVSGCIRVFLVPRCGHDTVRAVERDRTCLCGAGGRVGLVYGSVNAEDREDDAQAEFEQDEDLLERALLAHEDVQ